MWNGDGGGPFINNLIRLSTFYVMPHPDTLSLRRVRIVIVIVSTRTGTIPRNPIESAVFACPRNREETGGMSENLTGEWGRGLSLRISSLHILASRCRCS